jgi:excinuclease ABC subunit A
MEELSPRLFSFNSPYGACPHCHGLGSLRTFSPDLVVPDPEASVYAAIAPWSDKDNSYYLRSSTVLDKLTDLKSKLAGTS